MILSRSGDWIFDYYVSKIFDVHVRKSIPYYNEIQNLIASISQELLTDKAVVYDLGTATGEVIYNIYCANKSKRISYIGIDKSSYMLKMAKKKCRYVEDVTFYNEKIETFNYSPSDLIVSAFTIQFIKIENRKQLLHRIKNSLKAGGSFILCEKIAVTDDQLNKLFSGIHEKWKLNFFLKEEIISKKNSLNNVMHMLTLSDYINLLRTVGFSQIITFFQWCNFVCILAK